ncbi:MAG: transitional endoplasmic reticulum ATPase [Bradymonadia bacterium]|jgi:transitional endoplasmic reticulum ATPase
MDDITLTSLRSALMITPANAQLNAIVLGALLKRGDDKDALALVNTAPVEVWSHEDAARLGACTLRKHGEVERAIDLLTGDAPESLLEKAECLLALDRRDQAKAAYDKAVGANSTLQNAAFEAKLASEVSNVLQFRGPDAPKLRVVSNDDTFDEEVDRILSPPQETVSFKDVGGLADVKKQIHKRIILPFQKPSMFERFKKKLGGGILMYGPPGCGKTLLARATAGECNAEFINVAISDVLDMYIGESQRKLNALFERARSHTPSVLFFDEIEALGGRREHRKENTSAQIVSQFLAEMDGFAQNNQGVLILGATNVPWSVDPAFRRPGRFDRVVFVPPPDKDARKTILEMEMTGRPAESGIDFGAIAGRTSGYSGADLTDLVETAADYAIDDSLEAEREVPISQKHLLSAMKESRATTGEWLTTARNYAQYANDGGQYDDVLEFLKVHGKK